MMFRLPRLAPPEQTLQLTRIGRSTDGGMIGLLGLIDMFELSMESLVIILYMFDYSIIINNLIIVFTVISFLSMVMNFMYRFAYNIERDAPYFLVE
jgi:hypothetical protein